MTISFSSLAFLNLHVVIHDTAFRSWIKSQRRLFKTSRCPLCRQRARVRRGYLLCDSCNRGWPLDDIQDLISEIEAVGEADALSPVKPGSPVSPQS